MPIKSDTHYYIEEKAVKKEIRTRTVKSDEQTDPREVTAPLIRDALARGVEPVSSYPRAAGLPELREAVAGWVRPPLRCGARPRPRSCRRSVRRSSSSRSHRRCWTRPAGRDLAVVTAPGYTIAERGARFAGGGSLRLPLREAARFLPDLEAVDHATWERTALLWLNYPNNPTGAVAPLAFLRRPRDLAREHGFLLACDEAYSELWFDGAAGRRRSSSTT